MKLINSILYCLFCLIILSGNRCKDKQKKETTNSNNSSQTIQQKKPEKIDAAQESYDNILVDSVRKSILYPPADSLFCSLERTACFGMCPMYKISIFNKGEVVYQVRKFVEKMQPGFYKTRININLLDSIINIANHTKYFSLKNRYPDSDVIVADLPSTITFLNTGDKNKKINNGNYQTPAALSTFENYIDSLFKNVVWNRITVTNID